MSVVPLQPGPQWLTDARDGERAMRVSWHLDRGCVVLSMWRDSRCVATTRLTPDEAAHLIQVLSEGLAAAASTAMIDGAPTG